MSGSAILFCAMLLDALLGEPDWLWHRAPHPAVLLGRLVSQLDKRLNTGSTRKRNGFLCAAVLVVTAGAVGWFLSEIGPLVEIVVTAILLAQRSLVDHVRAVADGLRVSLQNGRTAVSMIVSRETKDMRPDAVARSAIESAAENMSDGVIAPAFWFLVGGLPGILIYKAVNTADSMIGYMTPRHKEFGWAAARLDDLLNLIPARLTAGLFAVAGRVADFHGIRADAAKHKSPNAGWPEAALSRALDIALAGPRTYNGTLQSFPWVNATGRKSLSVVDIDDTIGMLWKAWGLMLVVIVCTGVLV